MFFLTSRQVLRGSAGASFFLSILLVLTGHFVCAGPCKQGDGRQAKSRNSFLFSYFLTTLLQLIPWPFFSFEFYKTTFSGFPHTPVTVPSLSLLRAPRPVFKILSTFKIKCYLEFESRHNCSSSEANGDER